jgi:hypothetical protein
MNCYICCLCGHEGCGKGIPIHNMYLNTAGLICFKCFRRKNRLGCLTLGILNGSYCIMYSPIPKFIHIVSVS